MTAADPTKWDDDLRAPDAAKDSIDVHKFVMRTVHQQYDDPRMGLSEMASVLKTKLQPPREKISILIIGNHSAGKSSFINWYIQENIQKESVAMETTGFTFVISGKKRDTLRGRATQKYVEIIDGIEQFDGVIPNLSTEVCTSTARKFQFIDFIDTPGLTDGNLKYPYDINNILIWLAKRVHLILVFFDPHGQATCERTNTIVRELNKFAKDKMHFFLTRADEIRSEQERAKVISQLSQSLSRSVADNQNFYGEHALEVRTIYRPSGKDSIADAKARADTDKESVSSSASLAGDDSEVVKKPGDFNQLHELLHLIDKTIKENVQDHCERLEKHAKEMTASVEKAIETDAKHKLFNKRATLLSWVLTIFAWLIPTLLLFYLLRFFDSLIPATWKESGVLFVTSAVIKALASIPASMDTGEDRYRLVAMVVAAFYGSIVLSKLLTKARLSERSEEEVQQLHTWQKHLKKVTGRRGMIEHLWSIYLGDATRPSGSLIGAVDIKAKKNQ